MLARKWRPRSFREMVGQEHVLKALINALDHKRLHHAYLFTGTRGVGKTTIARILAKCLNCEGGVSSEPCGECSACVEIAEGRFVDLIEVDAASRTKVEDTRELLDNVQYAPTRGRYKIYLIDEVHMLSNHSFNALLKTLEEPPEHVKFLLATTDPQKLPVTILSRCLQFNLKNMSPERIVQHLQFVLKEEMVPFEDAGIWQLARSADGSMRDAMSLTDQAIAFGNGKVADVDVTAMLGSIDHRFIERLVAALIQGNAADLLAAVAEFAEQSPDYYAALADLTTVLHRIAIAQALPDALDNSYGDREQILRFAHSLAAEDVQLFYQTALMGRRDLHLAPDPRGGFEMVLLRMMVFKPQGVADVPSQPLRSSDGPQGSDTPATANTESAVATQSPAQLSEPALGAESNAGVPPAKKSETVERVRSELAEIGVTLKSAAQIAPKPSLPIEAQGECDSPLPQTPPVRSAALTSVSQLSPDNWFSVYQGLSIRGVLQSTVANCVFAGSQGNQAYFVLNEQKASLFDETHNQRLSDVLSDYFGEPIKAHIQLQALDEHQVTPAMHVERIKEAARIKAVEQLCNDPVMKLLQRDFSANLDVESVTFSVDPRNAAQ